MITGKNEMIRSPCWFKVEIANESIKNTHNFIDVDIIKLSQTTLSRRNKWYIEILIKSIHELLLLKCGKLYGTLFSRCYKICTYSSKCIYISQESNLGEILAIMARRYFLYNY